MPTNRPLRTERTADEIVDVDALHHDDDHVVLLAVEPRVKCAIEPLLDGFAPDLGHRVRRLDRIADNDEVAAAPGERAAERRPVAVPWCVVPNSSSADGLAGSPGSHYRPTGRQGLLPSSRVRISCSLSASTFVFSACFSNSSFVNGAGTTR